jgi:hypothetical protein
MARWQDVVDSEPEFAAAVLRLFDASKHKTMATVRADGSPRMSGIETTFADGDLWLGSMNGSRKSADLERDGRLALHSQSVAPAAGDESAWEGDAKLSGVAIREDDPARMQALSGDESGGDLFRVEISEVVLTRLGTPSDHLEIQLWRPGKALSVFERY